MRRSKVQRSHPLRRRVGRHVGLNMAATRDRTRAARQRHSRQVTPIRHIRPLHPLLRRRRRRTMPRTTVTTRPPLRKRAKRDRSQMERWKHRLRPRHQTPRIWTWLRTRRKTSYASSRASSSRLHQQTTVCAKKRSVAERTHTIRRPGRVRLPLGTEHAKGRARWRGT